MTLLRWCFGLVFIGALVWFSATVELGSRTLVEHVRAIASTREAAALAAGTKDEASKVADRVQRALAKHDSALPPRNPADPAVRTVERPRAANHATTHPAGHPASPSDPPAEALHDDDRAALDRLVHEKADPAR